MINVAFTKDELAFLLPHAQHRVERLRKSIKNANGSMWMGASPKYRDWALARIAECERELPAAEALVAKLKREQVQ